MATPATGGPDVNFAGHYQRAGEEMLALWRVAVDEIHALIAAGWD